MKLTERNIAELLTYLDAGPLLSLPGGCLLSFSNRVLARFGERMCERSHSTGSVTEAEARERERGAFGTGAAWGSLNVGGTHLVTIHDDWNAAQNRERDARYPSLTPTPRTVTLSTGETHWYTKGLGWQGDVPCPEIGGGKLCSFGPPRCVTLADFEACAKAMGEAEP